MIADRTAAALTKIRPLSPVQRARKELARELVAVIRALDAVPAENLIHAGEKREQDKGSDSP